MNFVYTIVKNYEEEKKIMADRYLLTLQENLLWVLIPDSIYYYNFMENPFIFT